MEDRLARHPEAIRSMFAAVAPRYDLLNRLLSLRQDVRWRRRLVAALALAPPGEVLDLATGTGDVAVGIQGRPVIGLDFCLEMLTLARSKATRRHAGLPLLAADALFLPFKNGAFAAVAVAFGLRNLSSLDSGLAEIRRVLRPGGVLAVLEFQRPRQRMVARALAGWNRMVVGPVGCHVSREGSAYAYLPASVKTFPDSQGLAATATTMGFTILQRTDLSGGIAALTVARWRERA